MPHTSYDARDYAMAEKMAYDATTSNTRGGLNDSQRFPSAVRKESPVNTVRDTLKQSHELSNYVHSLVNRLCGPQPEEAKQDGIGPSNGILFDVESEAHDAARSMQAAMNALRRLESHLP